MEPPFPDQQSWLQTVFEQYAGVSASSLPALAPRQPDELDRLLGRTMNPVRIRGAEPLFDQGVLTIGTVDDSRGFWQGVRHGIERDTPLISTLANYYSLRMKAQSVLGSLAPVKGYDPINDPQIRDAGLENDLPSFAFSQSPNETAMRIMALREKARIARDIELANPGFHLGAGAGAIIDPSSLGPAFGIGVGSRTFYGAMWKGVRGAAGAAAFSLGTDLLRAELGDDRAQDGVLDAMAIAGAMGGTVGLLHGMFAKRLPVARRQPVMDADDLLDAELRARGVDPHAVDYDADIPDGILRGAPPRSPSDAGGDIAYSLSAAAAPGMAQGSLQTLLERESLVGATLMKYTPFTPMLRLKDSSSLYARQLVEEMVDLAGLKVQKNVPKRSRSNAGDESSTDDLSFRPDGTPNIQTFEHIETTANPVEAATAIKYRPSLLRALSEIQAAWIDARLGTAVKPGEEAWSAMKLQAGDLMRRATGTSNAGMQRAMTFAEFDERVAKAIRRGGIDSENDHYTQFVVSAAAAGKRHFDLLRDAANNPNVDLFGKAYRKDLEDLRTRLAKAKKLGEPTDQLEDRIEALERSLDDLRKKGPHTNTAMGYFPRLWNQLELANREGEFIERVRQYFVRQGVDDADALKTAKEIHEIVSRSNFDRVDEDILKRVQSVGLPLSAHARTFQIQDLDIEDFLESSTVMALRHQTATFAPAIELTARFGDVEMARQIERITEEYKTLHAAAPDATTRQQLNRRMRSDIDDVLALRDRLLNVAGASKDPHAWSSRTIRLAKNYMAWTTMGLSAFSQLGDLFRPAIVEGLDSMHRYGFKVLTDDARVHIGTMARKERLAAGDALELVLASKAMAAADIGDVFHSRTAIERNASKFTGIYYTLNGMNAAVDFTKDWASKIIIGHLDDMTRGYGKLGDIEKARLASLDIDGSMANRIAAEIDKHGAVFRTIRMPNTEAWTDTGAQYAYRSALQRSINRNVITPGAADRPIWMTTELGSLIAQFRTFGMSSMLRTLYAGLQDNDRQFWTGAAVLVGGALVLNELRSQAFLGKSTFDQPWLGTLADAVDRSGVLGSVMDVNNMIEAASGNRAGLRPMIGARSPRPASAERLASTFLGPSAGKSIEAAQLLGRVMQGDNTARTWRRMRGFIPGQNLPYVDPLADMVFPR